MPDIHIRRDHSLGLAKARKMAWQWAEEVESKFDMECTVIEGEDSDVVEFTRSGVNGRLTVAADHFDLHAKLGFLLGAFAKTIESEIQKNLDALLAASASGKAAAAPATPKTPGPAARTAVKTAAKTAAATKAAPKKPAR